ncbi:MAG: single-stranded DNA-binding protein [Armatimonadetes bacterium]|nr:single-stranded DNA-binding protein [Armatimonadota bacterium]
MLNQVVLIGRIGRDPELRYTPSGIAVASFSLAVNRRFKSQSGEEETDWFNIVAWKQNAEFAANYLTKGRLIAVQGRLQSRNWVAQDGTKRNTVEVVADRLTGLDKPKDQVAAPVGAGEAEGFEAGAAVEESDADYDPFAEE